MWNEGPIVVIDDDQDEQYFYRRSFKKLNLNNPLVFFDNGKDALAYLQQPSVRPFLTICDINMPVMNGLELRELMCKDERLYKKYTPFIFLSTSARQEDINRASELYVHGFFEKQTSIDAYEQTLKMIIEYWRSSQTSHQ